MLNLTDEQIASLVQEYGTNPGIVSNVVDAANSFEFIPDDELRSDFVETVLISYITNRHVNPADQEIAKIRTADDEIHLQYQEIARTLGDVIADQAYDSFEHYMRPYDGEAVHRVRTKYENIK